MRKTERPEAKVLLVQSGYDVGVTKDPTNEPPIGLGFLASYLFQHGIHVDLFDFQVQGFESFSKRIQAPELQVIGFSASSLQVFLSSKQAEFVKKIRPDVTTVLGGIHAGAMPEQTAKIFPQFDYIVAGEGEQTLLEIAAAVIEDRPADKIPGLAFKRDGIVALTGSRELIDDLDSLPFPDRSLMHLDRYHPKIYAYKKMPFTGLLASRGCPYNCNFCCVRELYHRRFRYCTVDWLMEDIRICITDHGIRDFWLYDDTLNVPKGRVGNICEGIINAGLKISWACFLRADDIEPSELVLMKKAGCFLILFGFEVGEDERLAQIGKGKMTIDKIRKVVSEAKNQGIGTNSNFIIGFPGESETQAWTTIKFARSLSLDIFTFTTFYPFPGAPLTWELHDKGRLEPYMGLYPKFDLPALFPDYEPSPEMIVEKYEERKRRFEKILQKGFLYCLLNPRWMLQNAIRLLTNPGTALRFLRSALWRFSHRFIHG